MQYRGARPAVLLRWGVIGRHMGMNAFPVSRFRGESPIGRSLGHTRRSSTLKCIGNAYAVHRYCICLGTFVECRLAAFPPLMECVMERL